MAHVVLCPCSNGQPASVKAIAADREAASAIETRLSESFMTKSIASGVFSRRPLAKSVEATTLICFSHLRWDFVYQRPQHLMSRFASQSRVFYVEEPVYGADVPRLELSPRDNHLTVVVPQLPHSLSECARHDALGTLISDFLEEQAIASFVAWYYTPMALPWTRQLQPVATVRERELIALADVVFTGGTSLYEAKRSKCDNAHCFPSSVDAAHFRQARTVAVDPADQSQIPHIRLGFAGVIDERMDLELLAGLADARPEWQIVLVGPVVKIDPAQLPQRANIHYLGAKAYADLPSYLGGWDFALMPFALNESTRFISPTKTPEYLAAGLPVVSTPIRDVVAPYGVAELARIGRTAEDFVEAIDAELVLSERERGMWLKRVDGFLSTMSWDRTHQQMSALIAGVIATGRVEAVDDMHVAPTKPARRVAAGASRFDVALEV
jgi:UDP-galactopyranose mutase